MHLVPVIQLEIEIARTRCHQLLRRWGGSHICLNAYFPRYFQTSRTDMRSLRYSAKCVGKNASGSSHPTWNQNRENTLPPTSEETIAFAWMHTFQDTFKLQEQTWGCWDIQQNKLAKMHLLPVVQLENRNCETTSQVNSEAAVAFAWVRRLQNTPKFHKPPWGCHDIQQNVLATMDLANQAGAFGFLGGGFAVASCLLQFNTLHSSLAIASPVCLSQFSHHCSSLLSSDEDDTMLAV